MTCRALSTTSPWSEPESGKPHVVTYVLARVLGQFYVITGHSAPGREDASGAGFVAHSEIAVHDVPGDARGATSHIHYSGH